MSGIPTDLTVHCAAEFVDALSTALNHASTAILDIDRITEILARAARRCGRAGQRCDDGELRVITRPANFERLFRGTLAKFYAAAHEQRRVMRRLLSSIEHIAMVTPEPHSRAMLAQQALPIAAHVADARLLAAKRHRVFTAPSASSRMCRLARAPSAEHGAKRS